MIRNAIVAAALVAATLLAGCREPQLTLPQNYLRLESPGDLYADRSLSADAVYLAVRRRQPAQGGSLEFWARAVRNELVGQGYVLGAETTIASADDVPGVRLDFSHTAGGRAMGYSAAVYVHADRVTVAEAGGPKAAFDADRERLQAALASVKLR